MGDGDWIFISHGKHCLFSTLTTKPSTDYSNSLHPFLPLFEQANLADQGYLASCPAPREREGSQPSTFRTIQGAGSGQALLFLRRWALLSNLELLVYKLKFLTDRRSKSYSSHSCVAAPTSNASTHISLTTSPIYTSCCQDNGASRTPDILLFLVAMRWVRGLLLHNEHELG